MKEHDQINVCEHKFIRNHHNNGDVCTSIYCSYERYDNPQSKIDDMKALLSKHISLLEIRDSYSDGMTIKLMFDDVEISSIYF
jgi:hypothetical protein